MGTLAKTIRVNDYDDYGGLVSSVSVVVPYRIHYFSETGEKFRRIEFKMLEEEESYGLLFKKQIEFYANPSVAKRSSLRYLKSKVELQRCFLDPDEEKICILEFLDQAKEARIKRSLFDWRWKDIRNELRQSDLRGGHGLIRRVFPVGGEIEDSFFSYLEDSVSKLVAFGMPKYIQECLEKRLYLIGKRTQNMGEL